MAAQNPFITLGNTLETTKQDTTGKLISPDKNLAMEKIWIETILRISENAEKPKCWHAGDSSISLDALNGILFERLIYEPEELVKQRCNPKRILYLYGCYQKLFNDDIPEETRKKICSAIIEQATLCLMNQPIYPEALNPPHNEQLKMIVMDNAATHIESFIRELSICIDRKFKEGGEEVQLQDIILPSLKAIQAELAKKTMMSPEVQHLFGIVRYFLQNEPLVLAFMKCQKIRTPQEMANTQELQAYMTLVEMNGTLLITMFNISCLGSDRGGAWDHFQTMTNATIQDVQLEERNIWRVLGQVQSDLFEMFNRMLRVSANVRSVMLEWIGFALELCSGRSKWNGSSHPMTHGFAINLMSVLLRLAQPFCNVRELDKVLKVDFGYGAWAYDGEIVRIRGLEDETSLLPRKELPNLQKQAKFPTECFFAVHEAMTIGTRVVHERLLELNKELVQRRKIYDDALAQITGPQERMIAEAYKKELDTLISRYQTFQCAVFEPEFHDNLSNVMIASAHWLTEVATNEALDSTPPEDRLSIVPEYILENLCDTLIMTKRFSEKNLQKYTNELDPMMRLITTFMGSPERVNNPHLRAKLAEVLEALVIHTDREGSNPTISNSSVRHVLEQPVSDKLAETLIHVFVNIETTGQSVSFEEKFQYRRPMYLVLEQIWNLDKQRSHMEKLSNAAIEKIEDAAQPLFLKFANLLINDATFLVDESFQFMQALKTLEKERATWDTLSSDVRAQNEQNFRHQKMIARFHNVMSRDTIRTLTWLTTSDVIRKLFIHPVLIDRITAMLNFFLVRLVGPEKKNLRVQNLSEYEFNPALLVGSIAQTYLNLAGGEAPWEARFIEAIVSDERSYKLEHFNELQKVLSRISCGVVALRIEELTQKLGEAEDDMSNMVEMNEDAPDDFKDPLMFTLMKDPVILPTSGITIDRNTIARHLLSDQTDPFNRQPLSLEQVTPDDALRERIEQWLRDAKK